MAEYRVCFSVAGDFGAEMKFHSSADVSYGDIAKSINKEKVAELLCLKSLGYTSADIEIITPEEYDEEFGEG